MNYIEFKQMQHEEANTFSDGKLYFIFETTEEKVIEKLAENGLRPEEVVSIGSGTFIKKTDYEDFINFFSNQAKAFKEFSLNNIYDVLIYELANHELEINLGYSYKSFLTDWLDLSEEEIESNKEEINRAIKDYKENFYKHN